MENGGRINCNRLLDKVPDERLLPNPFLLLLRALVPFLIEIVLAVEQLDIVLRELGKTHHVHVRLGLGSHAGFIGDNHCQNLRQCLPCVKDRLRQEIVEILACEFLVAKHFGIFVAKFLPFFKQLFNNGDIRKAYLFAFLRKQGRKFALDLKAQNPEQRRKDNAEAQQSQHGLFER